MARINLLPWREELREQRKQQFLVILGGVLVASAALVFLGDQYFTAAIENQNAPPATTSCARKSSYSTPGSRKSAN